jgi:hypothetical protein
MQGIESAKSRKHYEVTFETDEIATEEEYLLSDGWSPFVDTEVDGKTLIFAQNPHFAGHHAERVAEEWWDGRARMVEP